MRCLILSQCRDYCLVGCSKVSCTSQAWSARWRWRWYCREIVQTTMLRVAMFVSLFIKCRVFRSTSLASRMEEKRRHILLNIFTTYVYSISTAGRKEDSLSSLMCANSRFFLFVCLISFLITLSARVLSSLL